MLLSDLMRAVGEDLIRPRGGGAGDPDLNEVLLDDGATPLGPGQVLLATRPGNEQDLVQRAVAARCPVLVLPSHVQIEPLPAELAVLETDVAWTQLFVVLRTMLLSSRDETSSDTGPGSVHGLADTVAALVGGSVVIYDRAHSVISYSVQGHEIDQVRQDTILGKRTPDQWVHRFITDRTAYQTYAEIGRVVRMAEYAELHPRLRVAVHAGKEVIGEISVAEGNTPFPPHAEDALSRAARLAVPVLLHHRQVKDLEHIKRERLVRSMLEEGVLSQDANFPSDGLFVLGFDLNHKTADAPTSLETERFVHFLSLHVTDLDPRSEVAYLDEVYWAMVPAALVTTERLVGRAARVLTHLKGMGIDANAAVSRPTDAVGDVPLSGRLVADMLAAAAVSGSNEGVLTPESAWAKLVLVAALRGLADSHAQLDGPLQILQAHDAEHDTQFVETLSTLLDEHGSVSAASARLYVHPNTLRHRMQRIAEVSGLNLSDADERLAITLLVRDARTPMASRGPG